MSNFLGTAGDDTFVGTQAYDTFYLEGGGDDTANGRGGGDAFHLGAALTAADRLNGGGGYDSLYLNGDYSAGLVLGATTLTNFEAIFLTAGHSYDITAHDQTNTYNYLYVNGSSLGAGDSLIFDGAAETTTSYSLVGGAANDWLRGGAANDNIIITYGGGDDTVFGGNGADFVGAYDGALTAADRVNGGNGHDQLYLSGDYSGGLNFAAATLTGVEQIYIFGGYDCDLTLHDATIAARETLIVNAGLESPNSLTLDASNETDGNVSVNGSAGGDWLMGGTGDDWLSGALGADTINGGGGDDLINGGPGQDALTGGTGGDTFVFAWDDSPSQPDLITDLTNADAIDVSGIDVDPGDAYDTFDLVSSFSNTAGEMRLNYNATNDVTRLLMDMDGDSAADMTIRISGDHASFDNFLGTISNTFVGTVGANTFAGSQGNDYFYLETGGGDTANGRGSYDYFFLGGALTAADHLNGGGGYDTAYLDGNYSGGLVLGATTLTDVESIYLAAGHSYDITAHDQTNTTSNGLYVYGGYLEADESLIFDGWAETTSSYTLTGGAGHDWMRGGAGNDYLYISLRGRDTVFGGNGGDSIYAYDRALTTADRVSGGNGYDWVYLSGDYSGGLSFAATTIIGVEQIYLLGGYDYDLTLDDATVATGETLFINASALEAPNKLTLDASNETNGNVSVVGGAGGDWLMGGNRDDWLAGGMGADTINGGSGDDVINGGRGPDRLTGGTGGDTFVFAWDDSPSVPDVIKDLTNADAIDLSGIDVDPGPGYDTFDLVASFSNTAGEMRLTYNATADMTRLLMDMDGDSASDMSILISGQHASFDNFLL